MALDGGRTERQTPADAPASAFLAVGEVAAKGGWRHVVDAGAPIAAFLIGYQAAGPSAGVGAAVAVAIALTVLRLRRGDSPKVVVLSILGIVGYSALVLGTGEGRNFFVTEVVGCAILTVVFGIGTVLRRPLSLRICQRLRIEPRGETPDRIRLHRWITGAWALQWLLHVAVLGPLYIADQVAALGVATLLLGKPSVVVALAVTWWLVRRDLGAGTGSRAARDGYTHSP